MGDKARRNQPWAVSVEFAAADASKVIKAAPGANRKLAVTKLFVLIKTPAAQVIEVGDSSLTKVLMRLAASVVVGTYPGPFLEDNGVELTANEALSYKPAAAGPAGTVIAEGYITYTGDLSAT